jgi:methionine-gamma-lyase
VGAFAPLGPIGERSHALPLYQTSNFVYDDAEGAGRAAAGEAFLYSRHGNPTVATLEAALADLEGGEAGLAFASGQAALASVLLALAGSAGGEVLASEGIYGGSTELLTELGGQAGLTLRLVPAWDTDAVARALRPATRLVLVETLTNPLLRVVDVRALGRLCRRRGLPLVVDATISTPLLSRPLTQGADVVLHSVSKYIGGHGDLVGGAAISSAATIAAVKKVRTQLGGIMDPFCAWLVARGLRSLGVRVERQCTTAAWLARALGRLPGVRAVHHPSLGSHPDRPRATRLIGAGGALVSFDLGTLGRARRCYDRVRVIGRAASFGEPTSLLTHPATFSHKGLPPAERRRLGITDGLLRLSVGLEDPADLLADLRQALA